MARIVHALPCTRWKKNWIVRTDGVPDMTIKGEAQALAYARLVAQRLADRLAGSVILRVWNVLERYEDEVFVPSPDPLHESARMRRKAA